MTVKNGSVLAKIVGTDSIEVWRFLGDRRDVLSSLPTVHLSFLIYVPYLLIQHEAKHGGANLQLPITAQKQLCQAMRRSSTVHLCARSPLQCTGVFRSPSAMPITRFGHGGAYSLLAARPRNGRLIPLAKRVHATHSAKRSTWELL